jgi:hypothetical protein
MTAATLPEIVEEAQQQPSLVIDQIIGRLGEGDRQEFITGLSERLVCDVADAQRWLGSWLISTLLADSVTFRAQDDAAEKLIAAGQLGDGITHAELLARYGRSL